MVRQTVSVDTYDIITLIFRDASTSFSAVDLWEKPEACWLANIPLR